MPCHLQVLLLFLFIEPHVQPQGGLISLFCCRNIAEALVSKGLATVIRYRQDDDQRSSHYDELLAAEAR